ncbi:RNA polymerase sigma factor (sigma-70 family) [Kribbella orskensis]|uniref:RNA polymerase sigma factor (Sigma-70 family) n=1 Tax=Kribbella orskensis TaxID=2512216 RepID=A0ABY2BN33_9ACTN|nr:MULTISPECIES: sigma-70 family RNA polymerase sigma factor [Kribbella]TCN41919.1 RNA polymerase sigma factor (sigma-70 family) [Kribbella sp. VKM Ac-2500]TCO25797.1 RNA polymerase sigma factor (sigma-70 family) [Kribbella orskensis]
MTTTTLEKPVAAVAADDLEDAAAVFVAARPRLFKVAYRVLGSVCEAEDVMQDVWLRWQRTDRTVVVNPPAFLATMTARLAINVAKSARRRHETCVGPWLPDRAGAWVDPQTEAERGEAVEQAVHLLLERLSPSERAAYVLREGFEYPYRQIAETLQLGAANARQLVTRARQRLAADRRQPVTTTTHRRLLQALVAAAGGGDLAELEELLAADIPR